MLDLSTLGSSGEPTPTQPEGQALGRGLRETAGGIPPRAVSPEREAVVR